MIFFHKKLIGKTKTCKRNKMKNWEKYLQLKLQTKGYIPNTWTSYEKVNAKANDIRKRKKGQ